MLTFRPRVAVCLAVISALARPAAAQKDAFRDALIGFHATLAGDYGDEGPLVLLNLDRMASSLAKWDAMIRDAEQNARSRLATAPASDRARIYGALAELYIERGRFADALRELDAAILADGTRGALHVLRGLVLEAMARPGGAEEVVRAFGRASELDRDDPVAAYLLFSRRQARAGSDELTPQASQLLKTHDRRLASVPSDRHIDLFPQLALVPDGAAVTPVFSPALYADGFALVEKGRYTEAIASFRRAALADPLVAGAAARLERLQPAIARLRAGDAENAIPLLDAAAAAAPRSSEIHRILAAACADAGDDARRIEHLEAAASLAPDDERVNVALGRALTQAGQVDRAERVLATTAARLPKSADVHSALADLYERKDEGRRALHELEVAASYTVPAGKGALYWRLADLQHRHLEYEQVLDPLSRRAKLNPNDARAHADLGLAYTRVGRTADALVELLMASLIGPDEADTLTAIGQIHFEAGRYAAAEPVLRRAIALVPSSIQARYLLGHTLDRLGRAGEGREQLAEYDRLRAAANDDARRVFEINMLRQDAVRAAEAGRQEDAVAAWQRVVAEEPKRVADRVALANALMKAGRPEAALAEYETASHFDDADEDVYRQLAELYAKLGRAADSAAARQTYQRRLQEQRRSR